MLEPHSKRLLNMQINKLTKLALITGASGGIGREIAKALAKQGFTVLIQGRNEQKLALLKYEIGEQAHVLLGDISIKKQRDSMLTKAFEFGIINLLVNAAGTSQFASFESMQEAEISTLITTNLSSPIQLCQSFITQYKQLGMYANETKEVRIVNVGSAFGYIGYPGFSTYCASKFGLRGFTQALAREYSDTPFKFLYFAPRATNTHINSLAVRNMNAEMGNREDEPEYVAQQFLTFLRTQKRETVLGWPEKLFARVNSVFPAIVDKAIQSKLTIIKRYMQA